MQKKKRSKEPEHTRQEPAELLPEKQEELVIDELAAAAERYAGLYGAVFCAAQAGHTASTVPLHEFLMRARIKNPDGALCAVLTGRVKQLEEQGEDACAALATWLMHCIVRAGITCDREETLRLDAARLRDYADETGRRLKENERVTILSPCFRYEGRVIERGTARRSHLSW